MGSVAKVLNSDGIEAVVHNEKLLEYSYVMKNTFWEKY